jgi:hypothetical protein
LPDASVHRDWRSECLAGPDSTEELRLVCLDLHAGAASIAGHAAAELVIHIVGDQAQPSRQSFDDGYQSLPMGFACGGESDHPVISALACH